MTLDRQLLRPLLRVPREHRHSYRVLRVVLWILRKVYPYRDHAFARELRYAANQWDTREVDPDYGF